MIEISGLTVRFGALTAVDDLSLTLPTLASGPGIWALVGPNGAGKTTLLNAVSGFVRPSAGTVHVAGVNLSKLPAHRRARHGIARTFQTVRLLEEESAYLNMSVGMLGRRGRPGHRVRSLAITEATLERLITMLHIDREALAAPAAQLPFGTRRLVELARALACDPALLIMDEPAAGLTPEQRADLGRALDTMSQDYGTACLLTEHDMDFVQQFCSEVVVLSSGRFLAQGTPTDVLQDPAVRAAYFG